MYINEEKSAEKRGLKGKQKIPLYMYVCAGDNEAPLTYTHSYEAPPPTAGCPWAFAHSSFVTFAQFI